MSKSSPAPAVDQGVIRPDHLYTFAAFQKTTGIGKAGIREARKNGLRVRYLGRQGYILGSDIIAHVMEAGRETR